MFKMFWKCHIWNSNFLRLVKNINTPGSLPLNTKPSLSESHYIFKVWRGIYILAYMLPSHFFHSELICTCETGLLLQELVTGKMWVSFWNWLWEVDYSEWLLAKFKTVMPQFSSSSGLHCCSPGLYCPTPLPYCGLPLCNTNYPWLMHM